MHGRGSLLTEFQEEEIEMGSKRIEWKSSKNGPSVAQGFIDGDILVAAIFDEQGQCSEDTYTLKMYVGQKSGHAFSVEAAKQKAQNYMAAILKRLSE